MCVGRCFCVLDKWFFEILYICVSNLYSKLSCFLTTKKRNTRYFCKFIQLIFCTPPTLEWHKKLSDYLEDVLIYTSRSRNERTREVCKLSWYDKSLHTALKYKAFCRANLHHKHLYWHNLCNKFIDMEASCPIQEGMCLHAVQRFDSLHVDIIRGATWDEDSHQARGWVSCGVQAAFDFSR